MVVLEEGKHGKLITSVKIHRKHYKPNAWWPIDKAQNKNDNMQLLAKPRLKELQIKKQTHLQYWINTQSRIFTDSEGEYFNPWNH